MSESQDWAEMGVTKNIHEKKIRSCNRHENCEEAEKKWLEEHPYQKKWQIPLSFHCHDDCCEDCFGC